jgi:hypothetical protein
MAQAGDQIQQGGFPGAGGSEDCRDGIPDFGIDLEFEVGQGQADVF